MTELKALLFDVDGTLADTERDGHRVAFNAAFREAGLDWSWSVARYGELLAVTGGKERIRRFMREDGIQAPVGVGETEFIAALHKAKTRHYTELLHDGAIPLRQGVERLLREARAAGLRLAIATTTTPANVTALLVSTLGKHSLDWFEVIAAGDIVPAKKPAPDIFTYAMREMDLSPEECVAFEDSENGVISASDAGISAILVTTNAYTGSHDLSRAALVLDGLGEPGAPASRLAGTPDPIDGYVSLGTVAELHRLVQN